MSATPRPNCYLNLDYLGAASGYAEEVHEAICQGPLFEPFTRNEIEALCKFMHCFVAPREITLMREGEHGDHFIVILSGEVRVVKRNADGTDIPLAMVSPGASLGEMSLVDGRERFASCITTRPTDFAVMTRTDLNEFLVAYPWLANKLLIRLLQILADRLRISGALLVERSALIELDGTLAS
jgi:CRP/FNR family transcriptional regulator, cyclic AMP receptor protein